LVVGLCYVLIISTNLELFVGYIPTVNRNQQNYSTMDLPVELVGLLKHAGIDGKKLTWDLQVNSSAIDFSI
jgi:hypothetical protein